MGLSLVCNRNGLTWECSRRLEQFYVDRSHRLRVFLGQLRVDAGAAKGRRRVLSAGSKVTALFAQWCQGAATEGFKSIVCRQRRHGSVWRRWDLAHSGVHGLRANWRLCDFRSHGWACRVLLHIIGLGGRLLRHGTKVIGPSLYNERARCGERWQSAQPIAGFCALLQLLGQQPALERKGIERGQLWWNLASNV